MRSSSCPSLGVRFESDKAPLETTFMNISASAFPSQLLFIVLIVDVHCVRQL